MNKLEYLDRYVTKWALTEGIVLCRGEVTDTWAFYFTSPAGAIVWVTSSDHFATRQEAVERAVNLRDRKIKALKRQIERLERLTFR